MLSLLSNRRTIPVAIGALVVSVSLVSVAPSAFGTAGGTGATDGSGDAARVAAGGFDEVDSGLGVDAGLASTTSGGRYVLDGTILKPVTVDTAIVDKSSEIQHYVVRPGDTLTGIAHRFGVSMMTLWWANNLTSKDELHVGQTLTIPPVTGTVVVVKEGDTLEAIAAAAGVDASIIATYNALTDSTLIVGETLIIPGGQGAAIPTTAPTQAPARTTTRTSSTSTGTVKWSGARFVWPVVGGNNYISQYSHTGHVAIDIAATYGSTVRAAAGGTVLFAGWKDNGGGYQVWMSHGSGVFTTYNHMSALTVHTGQVIGAGTQVGRIGTSGWATGPHLHFEVWRNEVWGSGYRVNPLGYF